ncbi:polysaccharide biosynthesis/export family protein [Prosthecobacter sp.]|uniref:polysaccharide biosynthesis/export family protein n=1 Tax=Prosthecobacter sp. TaxID=1965333 RepID=UPI00378334CD
MKVPTLIVCCLTLLNACALLKEQKKFDARATDTGSTSTSAEFSQTKKQEAIHPEWLKPPTKPYALGPGDKVEIEIIGETGTRADTFVTPDSKLYFDLLPGIDVKGKSAKELREEMEKMLTRYYKQPQVSLTLREVSSQRVWVLGRLNAPGIYPLNRPMRVLDAVTQAGGLFTSRFTGTTEELADLSHSFLMRGGKMLPVDFQKLIRQGDLAQNIYLEPDDFIYLPSALTNEVYVLGAVTEPRPVGFMNEMNLITALGRGLGIRPEADLAHVTIVRGSLTEPKIATVNAKDIIQGKATNVRLEPGDIVYIPGSGSMSPGGFLHDAVNTFTRLVAANEGNAAGASHGTPIGVNLNIGSSSSSR